MTKHDAVKAFFEPKAIELAGDLLGFNYSAEMPDSIALITNYSDKVIKRYVRVGAVKEYGFAIIIVKAYSTNADDLNLEAMNYAQAFMDWVEAQDKTGNYPDFGERCHVQKMENLQNMPNLAGVNPEEGLARYMLQCKITYYESEV